jgi:hypothetical protein
LSSADRAPGLLSRRGSVAPIPAADRKTPCIPTAMRVPPGQSGVVVLRETYQRLVTN